MPWDMIEVEDGFSLPPFGLASFFKENKEEALQIMIQFFQNGGRFIEISELFSNSAGILYNAMKKCKLQREDLLIGFKIWPQSPQNNDDLRARFEQFLISNPYIEYIDILYPHAPINIEFRYDHYKVFEELKQRKLIRVIGLTNLGLNQLMTYIKNADILPVIYHAEFSPFNQQYDFHEYCKTGQITIINSEPLAKGTKNNDPKLKELAYQNNCTVEEILLRWSASKGFINMIPGDKSYLFSKFSLFTEPLSSDLIEYLETFDGKHLTTWAPVVDEDS